MKNLLLILTAGVSALLLGCSDNNQVESQPTPQPMKVATNTTLPIVNCSTLSDVDLEKIGGIGSKVTSSQKITNAQGDEVCEVSGTLAPTIGFKVQLPTKTWSQRYMQLGCGGLCGRIDLRVGAADKCPLVTDSSMALASTDMGHQGNSSNFGDSAQKRIDFAYRSVHLTSLTAKKLMREYYGKEPKYSYFNGCSDGGREALMEAQRFPDDFNGIIAGAPAMNFSVQNSMHHGWLAESNMDKNGEPILTAAQMPILHNGVLKQCDVLDGVKDGLIADPRRCDFDTKVLLCKTGQNQDCLTQQQVDAANRIYSGPKDPQSGLPLALGSPMPGSELAWPGVFVPQANSDEIFSTTIVKGAVSKVIYEHNPKTFTLSDLSFTQAGFDKLKPLYGLYSAVDPDLAQFKARGGKLILWHGWSDQHISPMNSIAYYEAVKSFMGTRATEEFMNFYLVPGMHHCFGGDGPSSFDLLSPLVNWVENGVKPDEIMTYQMSNPLQDGAGAPEEKSGHQAIKDVKVQSAVVRTLPLYPFPFFAKYNGSGDINVAVNYHKELGIEGPKLFKWAGAEFYQPGQQLNCYAVNNQLQCKPIKQ